MKKNTAQTAARRAAAPATRNAPDPWIQKSLTKGKDLTPRAKKPPKRTIPTGQGV